MLLQFKVLEQSEYSRLLVQILENCNFVMLCRNKLYNNQSGFLREKIIRPSCLFVVISNCHTQAESIIVPLEMTYVRKFKNL